MENNKIIFELRDGKVTSYSEKPMTFPDYLTIVQTGILLQMQGITNKEPEESRDIAKEELYDIYNAAASNLLKYYAPEIEMRPHLTEQAILEAENKIIMEGRANREVMEARAKDKKKRVK